LVMEDSIFGVTAAKAAKMTALGLRNSSYVVDLSHSDEVVDRMSYLMDWIK
ncbi:MAG: HAD family phosphatase, partial [Erysipelothrix sp.]|nr:HAD family phosphatase [Erysipelothrix sp.]